MNNWKDFKFNEPYVGEEITSVNGISLPKQYLEFMKERNGGEGDIGKTWLILYKLENLQERNDLYNIKTFLPDCIIIGSNGGGELYGINSNGEYFNVPEIIEKEYVTLLGNDINVLPDRINELWK